MSIKSVLVTVVDSNDKMAYWYHGPEVLSHIRRYQYPSVCIRRLNNPDQAEESFRDFSAVIVTCLDFANYKTEI